MNAVKLLRDTAARGYEEMQQKLMAPVYGEAMPLLRQILPKTTFAMNDSTLALEKIHREGFEEDFEMLSGGTRETGAGDRRWRWRGSLRSSAGQCR